MEWIGSSLKDVLYSVDGDHSIRGRHLPADDWVGLINASASRRRSCSGSRSHQGGGAPVHRGSGHVTHLLSPAAGFGWIACSDGVIAATRYLRASAAWASAGGRR